MIILIILIIISQYQYILISIDHHIFSGASEHSYSSTGRSVLCIDENQTASTAPGPVKTTQQQAAMVNNKSFSNVCNGGIATQQMWGQQHTSTAGSDGDSMPESPLSLDDGKYLVCKIYHICRTNLART